jgi:hypothetical protein
MLRRVTLVATDVSEKRISSIIKVTSIGELRKTSVILLIITTNVLLSSLILVTLMMEAIYSFKASVLT